MNFFKRIFNSFKTDKSRKKDMSKGKKVAISSSLDKNAKLIKDGMGNSDDVVIRKIRIGSNNIKGFLFYIDGMVDENFVAENIMKPIMLLEVPFNHVYSDPNEILSAIKDNILTTGEVDEIGDTEKLFTKVISGDTALFIEGCNKVLLMGSKGYQFRGIQEPEIETIIRGPREGFTEPLRVNTTLLRRIIKSPNLRFETLTIGIQTKTSVCLVYLEGVCSKKIVQEVRKRLSRIDTDAVYGAGHIEQFIEDAPYSLFSTVGTTERPDIIAGKVLEGRVAIIVDGTPIVLTVPYLFIEGFQSLGDYLQKPYYMTMLRWLRFLAFFITIYLPGIYISLTTFHQEMIPTPLLMTVSAAREGLPFPALVEALLMGVIFEFLREAGIRMPKQVGQAVSIVGALVIGEAAVSAGLVGAPIIIVTSLTAITSFMISEIVPVTTTLRFLLTVVSGIAGLYGIILGTIVTIIHLVALRSFGMPYLSPLAPFTFRDLKDTLVKLPAWSMDTRPRVISQNNQRRQGVALKPRPPQKN